MSRSWRVPVLVGGHAVNDLYQGAVPAIVPILVLERHYGYVAAGGIALAATVLSAVVQPLFGALTDRRPMPWLVPAGMIVAGLGVGACGLGESYTWTWLAVAVSGLGVAAYHPESARLARLATAGRHVGMSWFSLGGNIGFALGPIMVTLVLTQTGLGGTPLLSIPALLGGAVTIWVLRPMRTVSAHRVGAGDGLRDDWPSFRRLALIVVCRSIMMFGMSTFIAVFTQQRLHAGAVAGEAALIALFASGAAGTVLGGVLAERWGRVRTIRLAYLVTIAGLAGLVLLPGPAVYPCAAVVGFSLYVPFSLHVTLGQDYLPGRMGTASGVTLGLAVSVGGLAAPGLGALAELWSLSAALATLIIFAVLAVVVARRLPEPTAALLALQSARGAAEGRHLGGDGADLGAAEPVGVGDAVHHRGGAGDRRTAGDLRRRGPGRAAQRDPDSRGARAAGSGDPAVRARDARGRGRDPER